MTTYPIAERFKAPQGEGIFTGTPMAFIRFVGCSVGKGVCHACDTDFETILPHLDGGKYNAASLVKWIDDMRHVCFTGGEPLDRDLESLAMEILSTSPVEMLHVETSGTRPIPKWLKDDQRNGSVWLTISPKPGYLEHNLAFADEIKVIVGGLGDGEGWPTIVDAVKWADNNKVVYIQPRNKKYDIDIDALQECLFILEQYPQLRMSTQMHKFLRTR
jgi:7-carboxy-7-deazaguanine synthase